MGFKIVDEFTDRCEILVGGDYQYVSRDVARELNDKNIIRHCRKCGSVFDPAFHPEDLTMDELRELLKSEYSAVD